MEELGVHEREARQVELPGVAQLVDERDRVGRVRARAGGRACGDPHASAPCGAIPDQLVERHVDQRHGAGMAHAAAAPSPAGRREAPRRARHTSSATPRSTPGSSAMKLSLASRPTASAAPITAPRSGVSPWRNARASAQNRAAEAAKKRLSGVMPLPVNPNRGWNATASASHRPRPGLAGHQLAQEEVGEQHRRRAEQGGHQPHQPDALEQAAPRRGEVSDRLVRVEERRLARALRGAAAAHAAAVGLVGRANRALLGVRGHGTVARAPHHRAEPERVQHARLLGGEDGGAGLVRDPPRLGELLEVGHVHRLVGHVERGRDERPHERVGERNQRAPARGRRDPPHARSSRRSRRPASSQASTSTRAAIGSSHVPNALALP